MALKNTDKLFFLILFVYIFLALYKLADIPNPWTDEIAHLNTANHIIKEGQIWCDFYTSKFKEGRLFNSMPVQWILLAGFGKIFGLSVFTGRLLYIILSVITLIGTYLLAGMMFNRRVALISVLSIASSSIFFLNSRQILPQIPAATFGVLAILFFYIACSREPGFRFIISGVLAGLSYLSHPTGLGIAIIITFLFWKKKIRLRGFLLYIAGLLFSISPYLVYIFRNFQEYIRQTDIVLNGFYIQRSLAFSILDEIPIRYLGLPSFSKIFEKINMNGILISRYIYDWKWFLTNLNLKIYLVRSAGLICFLISTAYLMIQKIKTKGERELLFIIGIYMFLLSLHPNKFPVYLYVMMPYFGICLSLMIDKLMIGLDGHIIRPRSFKIMFLMVVVILYFSSNAIFIYKDLSSSKRRPYASFIEKVKSYIPKGSIVTGSIYFWPGLYKDYKFISVNQIVYETDKILREEKNGLTFVELSPAEQEKLIKAVLSRHEIEYILLTCHGLDGLTEAPGLARKMGQKIRPYLFNHAEKKADFLRENYYKGVPEAKRFEEEVFYPRGTTFDNIESEYQNSLKIYKLIRR